MWPFWSYTASGGERQNAKKQNNFSFDLSYTYDLSCRTGVKTHTCSLSCRSGERYWPASRGHFWNFTFEATVSLFPKSVPWRIPEEYQKMYWYDYMPYLLSLLFDMLRHLPSNKLVFWRFAWCIADFVLQFLKSSINCRWTKRSIRRKLNFRKYRKCWITVLIKEGDKSAEYWFIL